MIDFLASEAQYAHHLAPVWQALDRGSRGIFWAGHPSMGPILDQLGVEWQLLGPDLPRSTITASAMDHAKARRRKPPAMAYMEHGCGQSYGGDPRTARATSYAGGDGRDGCSLILAPNELAAARWTERYPLTPVHVVGATRILTPPEEPCEPLLAVSFHWSGGIPEQQNALGHYRRALGDLAGRLPMLGHSHPRLARQASRIFTKAGVPFEPDIREVARRATVYAVDNSSTLWELGRTRPVIALNAPHYRRHVDHGLRFWSHVPVMVDTPEQLEDVAHELLAGEQEEDQAHREAICAEVIPHLDGAERASRLLSEWAQATAGAGA